MSLQYKRLINRDDRISRQLDVFILNSLYGYVTSRARDRLKRFKQASGCSSTVIRTNEILVQF